MGVEQNPPDNHSGNSVYVHPGGISQPSPLAPPPIYRPSYAKYFYHAMPMNANSSATSSSSLSPSGSETEASTDGQTETRTKVDEDAMWKVPAPTCRQELQPVM